MTARRLKNLEGKHQKVKKIATFTLKTHLFFYSNKRCLNVYVKSLVFILVLFKFLVFFEKTLFNRKTVFILNVTVL